MRSIIELWRLAQPAITPLFIAAILLLLEAAAALAVPWIGGRFAEQVINAKDNTLYQQLLLIWLALLLIQYGLRFFSSYLLGSSGAAATARIRCRVYDHIQALPIAFHHKHDPGDMLSLLSRDAGILGQFFTGTLPNLAPQLLTFIGAWALMTQIDPMLAAGISIGVISFILCIKLVSHRLRSLSSQISNAHGAHLSTIEENLRLMTALKAFGREAIESERVQKHNDDIVSLERRHLATNSLIGPSIQALGAILFITLLWFSADRLAHEQLSIRETISLLMYALLISRPTSQLTATLGNIHSTLGATGRIQAILNIEPEPLDSGHDLPPNEATDIRFEDIHFSHTKQRDLFKGLNLEIKSGETLAITGPNGAGKSTLIHLLLRFNDPLQGRILLGGKDIRELKITSLRGLIGYVPQQVTLLNGSIHDNITYGVPEASEPDVIAAAKEAQAWDFIQKLPYGMNTTTGPDGIRLSGGQRQRLALARALLRKCPILILDEATSMFDPQGELDFIQACKNSSARRTLIMITHRPASLALADRQQRLVQAD